VTVVTVGAEDFVPMGDRLIPLLVVYAADGRSILKSDFYTRDQVMEAIGSALAASRSGAS
jgi:hypothetical protein